MHSLISRDSCSSSSSSWVNSSWVRMRRLTARRSQYLVFPERTPGIVEKIADIREMVAPSCFRYVGPNGISRLHQLGPSRPLREPLPAKHNLPDAICNCLRVLIDAFAFQGFVRHGFRLHSTTPPPHHLTTPLPPIPDADHLVIPRRHETAAVRAEPGTADVIEVALEGEDL